MQCLHALQGPGLGFTLVNGHSDYPGHFAGVFLNWCIGRVKHSNGSRSEEVRQGHWGQSCACTFL